MTAPARLARVHGIAAALAGEVRAPLAIDLCCGLGGWTGGLLAEGWQVVGVDIEEHIYGEHRYPAGLIIQDILAVDGRAFSGADLIVASPPCQAYSWMAMPWSRAKAKAAAIRADTTGQELARLNRLFDACFRIQREACEAAGRHIPMVVENVRGAQPWVGRSRWNFGSYHLWGDVPALMPETFKGFKGVGPTWDAENQCGAHGMAHWTNPAEGKKVPGFRFDGSGRSFQSASVAEGIKCGGDWFNDSQPSISRLYGSKSTQRKAASAMIAKIPLPLSRWIARCFLPRAEEAA